MAPDEPAKVRRKIDPRPAEHFDRYHERARRRPPDAMYDVCRMVLTPIFLPVYRLRQIGAEHVPAAGPVILTSNHFSIADHFFLGIYLRRRLQFMGKSELFVRPWDFIFAHGGVFPVLRGRSDEEAITTAHAVLERGSALVMYAEGGRSRSGALSQPRRGVGRVALESGAPVVPVAIHGSQHVKQAKRLRFPKVTVQYGEVMRFEAVGAGHCTPEMAGEASQAIFERIRAMWSALEEDGRAARHKRGPNVRAGASAPNTPPRAAPRRPGRGPG